MSTNCLDAEVIPLNSCPVLKLTFDNFLTEADKQYFRNYKDFRPDRMNNGPLISRTYSLLNCDELQELKDRFDKAIEIYTQEVLRSPSLQFRLVGSWFTKNTLNTSHRPHYHVNIMLSALTYFDDEVEPNDFIQGIIFPQSKFSNIFPDLKINFSNIPSDEYNIFNYEKYTIKPKHNDVIIFPGHMIHSSESNTTSNRFCIVANYYIKGKVSVKNNIVTMEIP
tara:strand:- start:27 stop:695 length:669 start_codon:yes stop_codon:yes gene_type:complete